MEIKYRIFIDGRFYYWGFIEHRKQLCFRGLPDVSSSPLTMEEKQARSQQYTTHHDKDGAEMYAGDIVTIRGKEEDEPWCWQVKFMDGGFCIAGFDDEFIHDLTENSGLRYRVIGHIYESEKGEKE